MRAFIAIELGQALHDELASLQAKLKASAGADVKWVEPQNIHLTLKFLGEVPENKIDKIKGALDAIAANMAAFTVSLSETGAFPNLNSPRVIWVGIKEGAIESAKLTEKIEEQLAKLGFPKEDRAFSAHLTLARVRSQKGRQRLKESVDEINNSSVVHRPSSVVTHITLFQSTLMPKGPVYTILYKTNLNKI